MTCKSPAVFDALESRQMLSVSLGNHGTLWIAGAAGQINTISVGMSADGASVVATLNGQSRNFDKALVKRIVVEGANLADAISTDETNGVVPIRLSIFSHAGDDAITIGDTNTLVSAGAGNDTITGGNGGLALMGGPGDDIITAGNGKKFVFAGAGNDQVTLGDGRNTVFGLIGTDVVKTGAGNDVIFAAAGDTVDAGGGANTIVAPHNSDPTLNNTGGGADTIVHHRVISLGVTKHAFLAGFALGSKLNREL